MRNKKDAEITISLTLDRKQLAHLRDMMSIRLPPSYKKRISTDLARLEKRVSAEDALWKQIYALCEKNGLATDSTAPDFSLDIASTPRLELMQLDPEDID